MMFRKLNKKDDKLTYDPLITMVKMEHQMFMPGSVHQITFKLYAHGSTKKMCCAVFKYSDESWKVAKFYNWIDSNLVILQEIHKWTKHQFLNFINAAWYYFLNNENESQNANLYLKKYECGYHKYSRNL